MIHKSQQQDIDRAGDRLLRETLEPLGWVLTGIEEDYELTCRAGLLSMVAPTAFGSKFNAELCFK